MSRRERARPVLLDGLTGDQLALLREEADEFLIADAEDLRLRESDTSRQAMERVAALGRLNDGLRRGEILVPDRAIRDLVALRTTETEHLEEVRAEYERELASHEAWSALLAHIPRGHRR